MTDKQIIIDGVDVSGCGELYNGCCCDNGSLHCKDQPNCKFKLEKRGYKLEQITEFTPREELLETITHLRVLNAELESYNEQLEEGQNIEIKENKFLREQLKRKEQECERLKEEVSLLKESNSKLQPIEDVVSLEKCYLQQFDQLKAENDELKNKIFRYEELLKHSAMAQNTYTAEEVNTIASGIKFVGNSLIAEENNKLHKTLTEIKEIAESDNQYLSDGTILRYEVVNKILQKISECEGNDANTRRI